MADAIRTNEISVIKIALAEKEKREQQDLYKKAEGTGFKKTILVIFGVIFIVAAIFGSFYLIQMKKIKDTPKPTINNVETFISYDSKSYIDTTKITNINDLSDTLKNDTQAGSGIIKALFLTNTTNGISGLLTSKNFLSLINTTAPGALVRSLSDKYLLGKYSNPNDASGPATFLILQTTDYNQAYASMLEWEKTLLKDLFVLFNINITDPKSHLFDEPWKDIIVNNKDTRVLYNENGVGILYYVFVNKDDFVITNNIDALKEVIGRLIIKNAKPL